MVERDVILLLLFESLFRSFFGLLFLNFICAFRSQYEEQK